MENIFETINLTKTINGKNILRNFNLHLKSGEINALLGPNGAGKTTFINIMLGLTNHDSGEILICGQTVKGPYDNDLKHKFAYLPDEPIVIDYLTGFENLQYMSYVFGNKLKDNVLEDILREFNLLDHSSKLVKYYSKGMKQRLSLSYLRLYNPKILVLDEPTLGLDVVGVRVLKESLLKFKEQGCTILFTTHDIHFCQQVADVVTIINEGKSIKEGYLHDFLSHYKDVEELILDTVSTR